MMLTFGCAELARYEMSTTLKVECHFRTAAQRGPLYLQLRLMRSAFAPAAEVAAAAAAVSGS